MTKSSHSEIESFSLCERRHFYAYGLQLTSNTTSVAAYRGLCGHAGLAAYYEAVKKGLSYDDCCDLGFQAAKAEGQTMETFDKVAVDNEVELLIGMYFEHWQEADIGREILATEYKLRVPTSNGNILTIVVDLITREPGIGIVATDFKFTYDFFNADSVDLNPQLVKYMAGLRMSNVPVARVQYDEIRTRETKENQLDTSKKFLRTPFKPTNARIKTTMTEHFQIADRIIALREKSLEDWESSVVRVANKMVCVSCPFKDICINDLNNWGRENLLLNEYHVREVTPDVAVAGSEIYKEVSNKV